MAKARAICTCATCGCTFEVTAYRANSSQARSFERWAEENIIECRACEEKRRAEMRAAENAAAAEEAMENQWPMLTGTEKQIAWATTIRKQQIDELAANVLDDKAELFTQCVEELVEEHTVAAWWIDNRGASFRRIVVNMMHERLDNPHLAANKQAEREAAKNAENDAVTIAEPENRTHEGIAEIRVSEARVSVSYRKDNDFRTLVKALGYRWDGAYSAWIMNIGVKTGTARERAAELGNRLLNAGFAIRIQDAQTLRDAVEGNYQPMTHRWIAKTPSGKFCLSWARDDDFYSVARKLPGAAYESPNVVVSPREYEAVLDFANTYGFRLTPGAEALVEEMRGTSAVVTPAAAKLPQYDEHPLSDVLSSSRDVIADLRDDG